MSLAKYSATHTIGPVSLRPFVESDREEVIDLLTTKEVVRYLSGASEDEGRANKQFNVLLEKQEANDMDALKWIWAIQIDGALQGIMQLEQGRFCDDSELEVTYLISTDYHTEEYLKPIMQWQERAARNYQRKLVSTIAPKNIKALTVLHRLGIAHQELVLEAKDDMLKVWIEQQPEKEDN